MAALALVSGPWQRLNANPAVAALVRAALVVVGLIAGASAFGHTSTLWWQVPVVGFAAWGSVALADVRIVGPALRALVFGLGAYIASKWFFDTPDGLMIYAAAVGCLLYTSPSPRDS